MSNHENEMRRERDYEDFFEWLSNSPCRYLTDITFDGVTVYFYPEDRRCPAEETVA